MKKTILFLGFVALYTNSNAQIGINTPNPQTTLDVVGNGASTTVKDGIRAPRITKQQLAAKVAGTYSANESGAMVYITDITAPSGTTPSLVQVAEVNGTGYYYFDGTIWKQVVNSTGFTNIYNSNGSLTGNRSVTQGTNTLAFTNAATSGNNHFSVDGSTFSIDAFNHRLGIGTITPETRFHLISGTAISNRYNIIDAANSTNQYAFLALRNTSPLATGNYSLLGFTNSGPASGGANWQIGSVRTGATAVNGTEEDFFMGNSNGSTLVERFRIASTTGNVGIGTSTPAQKLHIVSGGTPTTPVPAIRIVDGNQAAGKILTSDANGTGSWQDAGSASVNIYNSNGSLTSPRTVTQAGNTLAFTSTAVNGFSVDGTTLSIDAANHRLGIGTAAPAHRLHVVSDVASANRYNLIDALASTNQYGIITLRNTSPLATGNFSLLNFTNSGPTSGGGNWAIGSIRTGAAVTTGAEEDFYFGNSLGGGLNERMRITSAGNVGIGTTTPARRLHVNANSSAVRFESLGTLPTNTSSTGLVIDDNGDIYKNNTVSVEGQILRLGLNAVAYAVNTEVGLRFNLNDTAGEMGNAPNAAPNFINTIVGASITAAVAAVAGQGSPARTTDRIVLQPGIYKVQVRLVGNFGGINSANNVFLKSIVNNNEYSLVNFTNSSNQTTTYYFDDFINITGTAQTVDFTISPGTNTFTTSSSASPGTGNSYRSLILIQRLR
ncbi:hypothetical protein [Chryseobacterium sp. JUb7]|uniref:beta strand repeat-containing protein n=1 Tax=Chryseobacterium sp. JUb7 TaxID=2940599 RepID=UPI002168A3E5|nr:hypothetical protein [Chryseobacterium sp. JUb7]MCS3530919.1 hypothetical protein [Chryseobacterium sp. JUb7]